MGSLPAIIKLITDKLPWPFAIFLLLLGFLFEFRHEIRALFRSSVRKNERILSNIKSRVEIIELAKKSGISVPEDALKSLSNDIASVLSVPEKPAYETPQQPTYNSRKIRYLLGALGGFMLSLIVVYALKDERQFDSGVFLFATALFTILGILSAALFTSRKSGRVFSTFIGAAGALTFVAVSVALIAWQSS